MRDGQIPSQGPPLSPQRCLDEHKDLLIGCWDARAPGVQPGTPSLLWLPEFEFDGTGQERLEEARYLGKAALGQGPPASTLLALEHRLLPVLPVAGVTQELCRIATILLGRREGAG